MINIIPDQFNRPLHDLRISVIDRCNFRCPYCMPEEKIKSNFKFLEKSEWLTFDEITRLVKIFVRLGVVKVRLTGGEPLLRPNLPLLIEQLSAVGEIEDLALTTNASLLKNSAKILKKSGLKRLTVSIDTLDSRIFSLMSGHKGSLEKVLKGIKEAETCGFEKIKINCVIQKGVNDHKILDMVEYFKNSGHILRFIEYMDVGTCNHWEKQYVVPNKNILQMINAHFPLKPTHPQYFGEVAERYVFEDGKGEVGFISSVSQPFCRSCTRARLTTDGKFITCLFAQTGLDLRIPLREGADDQTLWNMIKDVWTKRDDRYSELRSQNHKRISVSKIEMFQLGG